MKKQMRIVLWIAILVSCLVSLGCNTLEGAGEDIEQGGQKIQDVAD